MGTTGSAFIFMGFSRWVHCQRIITPDADRTEARTMLEAAQNLECILQTAGIYSIYSLCPEIQDIKGLKFISNLRLLNPIHACMYLYMPFKHY